MRNKVARGGCWHPEFIFVGLPGSLSGWQSKGCLEEFEKRSLASAGGTNDKDTEIPRVRDNEEDGERTNGSANGSANLSKGMKNDLDTASSDGGATHLNGVGSFLLRTLLGLLMELIALLA